MTLMSKILLLAAMLWSGLFAGTTSAFALDRPSVSGCASPRAFATADNDIRLDGDTRPPGTAIPLPPRVAEIIKISAAQLLAKLPAELASGLSCDLIFSQGVYRVSVSGGRELFVADINLITSGSFFCLILYDPATGAVTQSPPMIGSKWPQLFGASDPLTKKPFVSSRGFAGNQIIFEERTHNGTVYNGVIYHYYEVGPRLELTRILALKASADFFDKLHIRELTQLTPTRFRLETFSVSDIRGANKQSLGYVVLERNGIGLALHVAERHPVDPRSANLLVTFNGESNTDDDFLRDGYTFYY